MVTKKINFIKKPILLIILFILLLVFPFIAPNLYFVHLANMIGIMFILILGLNLIFGVAGQISAGHGAFYALGAYTSALLTIKAGWPFWPAIVASVVVAGIGGAILGIPSLRLRGFYLAMSTLGFAVVLNVVLIQSEGLTGGAGGISGVARPSIFGYTLDTELSFFYVVLFFAALSFFIIKNLLSSTMGRSLLALRESLTAAESLGINTTYYKVLAFTISSGLAGLAGALFASLSGYVSPDHFTLMLSFTLLGMLVIGGLGSILGSLIGAVVMVLLPEVTFFLGDLHLVAYSLIFIIFIIFMPKGIAGAINRLR